MAIQGYVAPLITAQSDGTALTNTTTATSIIPPSARWTAPSGYFGLIGQKLRIRAGGRISTLTAAPGTLTLDLRLGTVATPIVVFNGGAMTLNVTAQTNATWTFDATLTLRAVGSSTSATLLGVGAWSSRAVIGAGALAAAGVGTLLLPDTAPAVGTGFDSTITNVLDFFATWSIANAANSIQLHDFSVESIL